MSKFSSRSREALERVHPDLVKVLTAAVADTPVDFTIDQGVRTAATQKRFYSYGRTVVNPDTGKLKGKPFGAIITNCDGVKKKSEHQAKGDGYGHAVDLYPFKVKDGKGFVDFNDTASLRKIAAHIKKKARALGVTISWGGDWTGTLVDHPHFELK